MMSEEVNVELYRAMMAGDLVGIADAICEAVVTLVGLAIVCGLPFDALFREVIASNLTKTNIADRPKLQNGPGYVAPRTAAILGIAGAQK
jgi:hypothetical protein